MPSGLKKTPTGYQSYDGNALKAPKLHIEYTEGAAWNISNAVFKQSFSVYAQDWYPVGVFFNPEGTKMYVIGEMYDRVFEYDLSVAWNVLTATYFQNVSIVEEEPEPSGVFFKPDGMKMYVIGIWYDGVVEYDLSVAWNVLTATYLQDFSVATQEIYPRGLSFKSDGTKMYVIGNQGQDVNEYNLGTPWNVSSAVYSQNFSVQAQEPSPSGVFFNPEGTKMYIIGAYIDAVHEYDLGTPWNISTAEYLQSFSVSGQDTSPQGVFFSPDGTKMYIPGRSGSDINEYDLVAPPPAGWRKIAFETEPPTPNAWNQLKREVGTGWKKLLFEGDGVGIPELTVEDFRLNPATGTVTGPEYINDQNVNTYAYTFIIGKYAEVDLGSNFLIKQFRQFGTSVHEGDGRFKIEYWDGAWHDWITDIAVMTYMSWGDWTFGDEITASKLRFTVTTKDTGGSGSHFNELEVKY
ncbi:MAG: hypothetical protein GH151_06970 [Bacteroidetes bacterium]|nr:hypothetical protein [Bacteroidota bacterium]